MSEEAIYQRKEGRLCAKYKDLNGKWKYLYRKTKAEVNLTSLMVGIRDYDVAKILLTTTATNLVYLRYSKQSELPC
jgi:hypothetical protein